MSEIEFKVASYGEGRCLMMTYFDPITGKKVARTSGTTDRTAAERAAGVWQDELNAGRYQVPSKLTWEAFRERFSSEKLAGMPDSTDVAYTVALDHLQRVVKPDRLSKLTAQVMSAFTAKLRSDGMKPTTIARHLRHVKAALRWAERQGLIAKAPAIDMPRVPKGQLMKGRPITLEEFERMLSAVPKKRPRDAAVWIRLLNGLWLSGLRLGEALALDWDDGDFILDTTGAHPVFRIRAEGQKSNKGELCPATPDFCQWVLRELPEDKRTGNVFRPIDPRTRKPMRLQQVGRIIGMIGEAAGVVVLRERKMVKETTPAGKVVKVEREVPKHATAHDLRRSFCTRWAKRVMPATLQRLARHANIATTMTYYVAQGADDIAADLGAGRRKRSGAWQHWSEKGLYWPRWLST